MPPWERTFWAIIWFSNIHINCVNMTNMGSHAEFSNLTIFNFGKGINFDQLPLINTGSPFLINNCLFHTIIETNPSLIDGFGIFSEKNSIKELIATLHMINNATYNCSNGLHNLGDNPDIGTIECTEDPFANISADDYSLNNSPNGGALLRGTVASPAYNWD